MEKLKYKNITKIRNVALTNNWNKFVEKNYN